MNNQPIVCAICGDESPEFYYSLNGKCVCSQCGYLSVTDLYNLDVIEMTESVVAENVDGVTNVISTEV